LFFEIWLPKLVDNFINKKNFAEKSKWRNDRELIQYLRKLKPKEFEGFIAELFCNLGFKAYAIGKSHDGGVDVIAEKNGIKNYIQCKKYINRTVTVGALRDFYGALADHLANGKGYFVTTNKFTLEAERFAEDKPIEIIDQFKLLEYIKLAELKENNSSQKLSKACPKCGAALVERVGKFGKFLGCSAYPKCHFTENINNQ
jgi:restriction system protein